MTIDRRTSKREINRVIWRELRIFAITVLIVVGAFVLVKIFTVSG